MSFRTHKICIMAAVAAAAALGFTAGPALSDPGGGALTIQCSEVSPELGGTIVFTPSGGLLGNCYQHLQGAGGPAEGGSATIVDCDEALGEGTVGIQVITPTGGVYTNCHVHLTP